MYAIKFAAADDGPPLFLAGGEEQPYLATLSAAARQFPDEAFAAAALRQAVAVNPRLGQRRAEVVRLW